ncbi:YfiR family protein [Shewanella donghaensis]|uniref:YfiR family protein n=1 Tax=Shewanella donghaensis TaxID=238836 RepID=UPI001877A249|nr:YfiR family protein [Shewanella donghaensis]
MHKFVIAFVSLTLLLFSSNGLSMEKEYAIKAGFLYNFARYGNWLEPHSEPFFLCSPDADFIAIANGVLSGQKIDGLPISLLAISDNDDNISQCSLLFITSSTSEFNRINQYKNIMIVGESEDFINQGGHIRFFLSGGKIRFEVSPEYLKQSGITMSSKVLRLGRVVGRQ